MRSSRVRRVKRTARKSISRALTRMPRSMRSKRSKSKRSKRSKSKRSNKRNILDELKETLSLPEVEDEQTVSVSVPKKKKSKKKKKKSKAWSAKLHGKGTKGKKGKKSHKKKHKKKKMKGGSGSRLTPEELFRNISGRVGEFGVSGQRCGESDDQQEKLERLYAIDSNPPLPALKMCASLMPPCTAEKLNELFIDRRAAEEAAAAIALELS